MTKKELSGGQFPNRRVGAPRAGRHRGYRQHLRHGPARGGDEGGREQAPGIIHMIKRDKGCTPPGISKGLAIVYRGIRGFYQWDPVFNGTR